MRRHARKKALSLQLKCRNICLRRLSCAFIAKRGIFTVKIQLLRRLLRPLIEDIVEEALTRDSKNIERYFRKQALAQTAAFIQENMPEARALSDKWAVLDCGLEAARPLLELKPTGLVCEFGVASGATLNHIADRLPGREVFGFDSFEGLPEDWRDGYPKGAFKRTAPPAVRENAKLVTGYFDKSLPPFLDGRAGEAVFLHVDCDLYSSTRTIFQTMKDRIIPGCVIVFDEYFNYPGWMDGEHRALMEFLDLTGFGVEYLAYCKTHQQAAIRLTSPV